jgi:gliding motility-associated-like protein
MDMKKNILVFFFFAANSTLLAQAPVISDISTRNTYPLNTMVISGSGFSSTPANLQVWFDQVKGTILNSTDFSIEVVIPAQAKFSSVEVINTSTGMSAKSAQKFLPSFYGEPFSISKFTTALTFTSPHEVWDLCSCDLDNDQKPDLLSTKFFGPATDLMVLKNTSTPGNMAFTASTRNVAIQSDHISCGDLDGDGKPDLVFTRSGAPRNSVHIIPNTSTTGTINLSSPLINLFLDNGHFATRAYVHDLNKDGKPEIIVSNSFNNTFYIFLNESTPGAISFNATPIKIIVTDAVNTYGIDVKDLNGDKLPEVIITQFQSNHIFILRNQSSGVISFAPAVRINLTGNLNKVVTVDLNKDEKLDMAVTSTLSNQVFILMNESSGNTFTFNNSLTLATGNGPWGLDVSDIDGDSDPDIVVANRNESNLDIFINDGNASPGFARNTLATSKPARNIISGDLDGDAKPDLAYTCFNTLANAYSVDIVRNTNCHSPKILNEAPLAICNGQTIRLQAVPALNVTFTWKEGANTIQSGANAFVDITTPGTYTVTTTGDGCSITSPPLVISLSAATVPSDPAIAAASPVCSGANLQLSTPVVTGGTYLWTGPHSFTSTQREPLISAVSDAEAGQYTLQVSVGDCRSNISKKTVEIANLDDFSINSSSATNTICSGSSLTLSVNSLAGYSYQWKKNNVNIGGQVTNSLVVTQADSYSVRVSNTALGCGKDIGPVTVKVLTTPAAALDMPSTACANSNVTFTNQSTVDPQATATYAWSFGGGKTHNGENPPAQTYATAGNYSVTLSISYTGVAGCTSATTPEQIVITPATAPSLSANPTAICEGETSTITVAGTYTNISWSNGATGSPIDVNAPGTYSVSATDPGGCVLTNNIVIQAKQIPTLTVSASKSTISLGEDVTLEATGAHTYLWSPEGSLNNPTSPTPIASPATTTTYAVTGTLTGGCSASAEITITVGAEELNIKPPVAFSPNGDTFNDFWVIESIENFAACTMNVFDGRGRRVYQKTGYNNDWDGTFEGKPVPSGTYYYVFGCPQDESVSGSVLIFR